MPKNKYRIKFIFFKSGMEKYIFIKAFHRYEWLDIASNMGRRIKEINSPTNEALDC